MNIKYTIPAVYRANTLSLCAWIWIESALYCQQKNNPDQELTIMEIGRMFQEFWGLDPDEFDIYHIRQCYYRLKESNTQRDEEPVKFPREKNIEVLQAMETIKEYMQTK